MFLKKKTVWIIIFFHTVFFISKLFSSEIPHPTYPKFLEIFPNGYPKYTGSGNSKSIGAFRMYLQDLGYIIVDYEGTTIGFRYYVSDYNEVENKTLSNSSETNISAQNNNDTSDINELSFGSFNSQTTIEKRAEVESISLWVKEINFQIKKIIKYPKIAKDRNQSGRVLISLSLRTNGNLEDINIESSSGFKSLDQSAINSIKKLNKFVSAPFEIKNKLFTFILPINYELEN